jgi:transposase-like protein
MARRKEPRIPDAILDQLLAGADARSAFDQGGLLDELKKAFAERALNAEMDHHLAGEGGENNSRNGYGRKSVVTDSGKLALEIPRSRGVEDLLLAVVDGLKGFPEAIQAVFPEAVVQTCIVHLLRQSLAFVAYKDRKAVAAALKAIYQAVDATAAEAALTAFEAEFWGQKYPAIGQSWRRAWTEVVPFYAFSVEIRRLLYTTNAIEALNAKLRRAVRGRGHFPTDEAALKLLYLVLHRAEKEWTMPPREWSMAKAQFAVLFGERFTRAMA